MTKFTEDDLAWLKKHKAKQMSENMYRFENKNGYMEIIACKGGGYICHVSASFICAVYYKDTMYDAILSAFFYFKKQANVIESVHGMLGKVVADLVKEQSEDETARHKDN